MKAFLRKIKIIDSFTMTLPMPQQAFVAKLAAITELGSTRMFVSPFALFSSRDWAYVGVVTDESFKIQRHGRYLDANGSAVTASGTLTEENGQVRIETELNAAYTFLFNAFVIVLPLGIGIAAPIIFPNKESLLISLLMTIIFGFVSLMFYFSVRRSVERMKEDLERAFFYLTKDN